MPEGSRAALPGYEWLRDMLTDPTRNEKVEKLRAVADELGCTLAQLAIAWCASNPHVSSVITGASRVEQVRENMGALEVLEQLTPEILVRVETITALSDAQPDVGAQPEERDRCRSSCMPLRSRAAACRVRCTLTPAVVGMRCQSP